MWDTQLLLVSSPTQFLVFLWGVQSDATYPIKIEWDTQLLLVSNPTQFLVFLWGVQNNATTILAG